MKAIKSPRMAMLLMSAFLIVLLIGVQGQAVQSNPQPDTSAQKTAGKAPDQLDLHFQKVQADLSRKDNADAAAELQKAAAFLEGEESRSATDIKQGTRRFGPGTETAGPATGGRQQRGGG